jgi:hypothetical protein
MEHLGWFLEVADIFSRGSTLIEKNHCEFSIDFVATMRLYNIDYSFSPRLTGGWADGKVKSPALEPGFLPLMPHFIGLPAPASPDQPHDHEQDYGADGGGDDRANNPDAEMNAETGE